MLNTMIEAKEILDRNGIHFWLDGGTLLWAYRDGKPDETDTDFSIFQTDTAKVDAVIEDFLSAGFYVYGIFKNDKLGVVEYSFKRGRKKVDIFVKNIVGKDAYHVATDVNNSIVYRQPSSHFRYFDTLSMGGVSWNIPNHVEDYLETYYGKTWNQHIDISTWSWVTSSPSIDNGWKISSSDAGVKWPNVKYKDGLAIIVKTHDREDSFFKFIDSATKALPNAKIYIADDSEKISKEKDNLYKSLKKLGHKVIIMPYDSGLSAGRNACMDVVKEKYVFMCDDDFIIPLDIDVNSAIKELKNDVGIVCGSLTKDGSVQHYELTISIIDGNIYKKKAAGKNMDIGLNFFVANREVFDDVRWDNRFIIGCEHLDFFLQLKNTKWKVRYFPKLRAEHVMDRTDSRYAKKRLRKEHWPLFAEKWGINGIFETNGSYYLYVNPKVNIREEENKKAQEVPSEYERIDSRTGFDGHIRDSHKYRYELAAKYITKKDIVVDAACGTGYAQDIIKCKEYIGVDLYNGESRTDTGKRIVTDLNEWSPNFNFNVLVSMETIEHIVNYRNMFRIANNVDKFMFSVPIIPTKNRNKYHLNDFTIYDVNKEISRCVPNLETIHFEVQDGIYGLWIMERKSE